jgi:hypothetical protein
MMMTEKYYTLPPPSPSPSFCYSTIYHSPKPNRIREIKNRLHSQKKTSTSIEPNHMKLFLEQQQQQPIIRTYSLYDVQERINYFEKKNLLDDEIENKCKEKSKKKKLNFIKNFIDSFLSSF